jgi:flagellar biosynthetic protein FliR
VNVTETQILGYVAAFVWPLLRISAMFVAMPLFSIKAVPARLRLLLSLAVTFAVMPVIPTYQVVEVFSYEGMIVSVTQVFIGLSIGLILQMVFSIVLFAGESIASSMGLGFAAMVDPQSGQQAPVIGQLYTITSTLIFLSLNGHLLLIQMLMDSFTTLPIGINGLVKADIWTIITWSSRMFSGGLLLAMPVIISLLLVNISFGVAARAAPQLNIFSVGLPITLMLGMTLIWVTLPDALNQFTDILTGSYDLIGQLLRL